MPTRREKKRRTLDERTAESMKRIEGWRYYYIWKYTCTNYKNKSGYFTSLLNCVLHNNTCIVSKCSFPRKYIYTQSCTCTYIHAYTSILINIKATRHVYSHERVLQLFFSNFEVCAACCAKKYNEFTRVNPFRHLVCLLKCKFVANMNHGTTANSI